MNKDNAKDFLPLVQALADGKVIQVNSGSTIFPKWDDIITHTIMFGNHPSYYRIKPEPIELEFWYKESNGAICPVAPKDNATDWVSAGYSKIKMREIL